jgi:uracil-DNA glycosylase family 4
VSELETLEDIAQAVQELVESPLYDYRQENNYQPVIGEGDPDADIMFVGEAPGAQEAKTGRPFVGNAGKILDRLLHSVGLERRDVYITNVVKDRPPDNRDPTAEEIRLYAPFLRRQIEIVQPRVIATLGRFAMDFFLREFDLPQKGQKIGDLHGQVLKAGAAYGDVAVVPLYHPAATFYNRSLEDVLEEDFRVLTRFIE